MGDEMKIENLPTKRITVEKREHHSHICSLVRETPLIDEKEIATKKFEKEVLNYLFENKEKHGILKIFQIKNMLIDAAVKFKDGRLLH